MQIYNCLCCIFISLIIVGATEFIAAVHLLYNVLSFYTCQSAYSLKFNERIYYSIAWRKSNVVKRETGVQTATIHTRYPEPLYNYETVYHIYIAVA